MTPFAAVLLAGGRSRRMGRDKALLPLPNGRLLWQRQLAILRALVPAELFISGPTRPGFPPDVSLLTDPVPDHGPLAGVAAALAAMHTPRLLVLAVDLPAMTAPYLASLLAACPEPARGVVPQHQSSGLYEPLAAVYPAACLPLAGEKLRGVDWSLQGFVRASATHLSPLTISPDAAPLFANWNTLESLENKTGMA